MNEIVRLENELLQRCREDYLGLWVIVRNVRRLYPEITAQQLREVTFRIISRLLSEEDVRIGQFSGSVFECWPADTEAATSRINVEWDQLGRDPNLGDIAWFAPKEECGRDVAR